MDKDNKINCTSQVQPMDSGVFRSFKCGYLSRLLQSTIVSIDAGKGLPKVNMKDALHFARASWAAVTPATIRNCFRKTGFIAQQPDVASPHQELGSKAEDEEEDTKAPEDSPEVCSLWEGVQRVLRVPKNVPLCSYLDSDNSLHTSE